MRMCPGGSSPQQAGTGPLRREPGSPTVVWRCRDGGADQHPCRGRGRPRRKRWLPSSSASLPGRLRAPRCRLPALGAPRDLPLAATPPALPALASGQRLAGQEVAFISGERPAGRRRPLPTGAVLPTATSGLGRPAKPRRSLDPAGRALPRPPPTIHPGGLLSACHRPRGTARHGPGTVRTSRAFCAGRSAT